MARCGSPRYAAASSGEMLLLVVMTARHLEQTMLESIEPAAMVKRLSRPHASPDAVTRDNAHLERQLAAARAELRRMTELRGTCEPRNPLSELKVRKERRRMRSAPSSRSP